MKKYFNFLLTATLTCCLSLSITSCKDDKNSDEPGGNGTEQQEQQAQEQAERENTCFAILDNLANVSNATDDFLKQTFEPSIGEADDGDANTRIVNTNTMEAAAERFADLVHVSIDKNTTSYSWSDDMIGSLTYNKSTDGKSWATVDVNIKQIPHLQKIIYRSPEQSGDNNAFKGTAYYRFGDVVRKYTDEGKEEYWVCVRPAFGPEKKEKSHWITLSPLPSKNVWKYKGSNNIEYALPTKLGDNFEHSQNFAEMLYAICSPQEWENNVTSNAGLPMFNDFDKDNIDYHSHYFWERVQKAWTSREANLYNPNRTVMSTVLGSFTSVESLQNMLNSKDGLNLLTNGYSWITKGLGATNSPTLYRYRFVNGAGNKSNMHQRVGGNSIIKYASVKAEVIKSKIPLNVVDDLDENSIGWKVPEFFGTENEHYIIRHATGAELSSTGKEDKKMALDGVTEVYRYNQYYGISNLDADPETFDKNGNASGSFTRRGFYEFGDVVTDENDCRWFCAQISSFGVADSPDNSHYAYFVSFDSKALGKGDVIKERVPKKDLAAQILFNLDLWFHTATGFLNHPTDRTPIFLKNIEDHADVSLFELFVQRDTLFQTSNAGLKNILNDFTSTIYRDDNDRYCVLRLVADYTKEQPNGNRDMSWLFSDSYSADPTRTMYVDDLVDEEMIRQYADDKWVYLPWYDLKTGERLASKGKRTEEESANFPSPWAYLYTKGASALYKNCEQVNMYREPLYIFTVKRVKDVGKPSVAFEDGTKYTNTSLTRIPEFSYDEPNIYSLRHIHYNIYLQLGNITLNGQPYDFKLTNKP